MADRGDILSDGALAAKGAMYGGGALAMVLDNPWASLAAVAAVLGFLLNLWLGLRRDRRERERHDAELARLRKGSDL